MTDDARTASAAAGRSTLPTWVLAAARRAHPGIVILNGRRLARAGAGQGYLLNTTRGAVLVRKSLVGEPRVEHAAVPGSGLDVTCEVCDERLRFASDDRLPREVYCTNCGTRHDLHGDGQFIRRGEPQAVVGGANAPQYDGPTADAATNPATAATGTDPAPDIDADDPPAA